MSILTVLVACNTLLGSADHTSEPGIDTDPPFVVDTSPQDGAVGIRNDQVVTLRFSEPMDPVSLLAAVTTSTPPDDVTLSDDGLELELVLPLAYQSGDVSAIPLLYDVTVDTAATDLAGNPLPDATQIRFTTAVRRTAELEPHENLFGNRRVSFRERFTFLGAGDATDNQAIESVMSWWIDALPPFAAVLAIESADLLTQVHDVQGNPGADFGAMMIDRVRFDSFAEGFTAESLIINPEPWLLDTDSYAADTPITVDLVPVLEDAWQDVDDLLQVRLSFERSPSEDSETDVVYFRTEETSLQVTYLTL